MIQPRRANSLDKEARCIIRYLKETQLIGPMASFVFSPAWFIGKDILIDLFSFFTLLLIAYFSYRFYRINTANRKYLYLSGGFLLLAGSFLAKITTLLIIYYYQVLHIREFPIIVDFIDITIQGIRPSYLFFFLGFTLFRFAHLLGLYLLYITYQDKRSLSDIVIITISFFMITYFSHNTYFAFHLMSFVLLVLMTYRYGQVYAKNMRSNTLALAISFGIIAVSQAVFMFQTNPLLYVTAEVIQLIGYFLLLYTFITILRHGKKKK